MTAYAKIPDERCCGKIAKKATKCILIGYDGDDGYRLFDLSKDKLIRSRDVILGGENSTES